MVGFGARVADPPGHGGDRRARRPRTSLPGAGRRFPRRITAPISPMPACRFPGVVETLAALKADGARLGVLTNKPQDLADLLLPRAGAGRLFRRRLWRGAQCPISSPTRASSMMWCADLGGGPGGDDRRHHHRRRHRARRGRARDPASLWLYAGPATELGADAVPDDFADLPAALKSLGFKAPRPAGLLRAPGCCGSPAPPVPPACPD